MSQIVEQSTPAESGHPSNDASQSNANATSKAKKRKPMQPRSSVWEHFITFEEGEAKKAKCKYCSKVYSADTTTNGTSALNKHIRTCKKYSDSTASNQTQLALQPAGDGQNSGGFSMWKFDQELIISKIAFMIIVDELPFKFVEGEGFRAVMQAVQPRFKIPSRFTVSRDCYKLYSEEKSKLMNFFKKSGQTVSLTTDTWTSVQRINYMCITAHFIDENWNMQKKIINFCPIESHRGEVLAREIDNYLKQWGIAKIFTVTVDNASSNDTCIQALKGRFTSRGCNILKGKYLHMRCIAHIINLVVVDGLKDMNLSVKRVRDDVRFIRQSPARLAKFKECCQLENVETKSLLCLDVTTRWNSTFMMLNALKFEKVFELFESHDPYFRSELSEGPPTFLDWEVVRRVVDMLGYFYDLTIRISGSLYVTSNGFYHEVSSLNCLLKEWKGSDDLEVQLMGETMKAKYDKYWGDPTKMNKLIYIAIIVDPRYKLEFLEFALSEEYERDQALRMVNSIREALRDLYESYKLRYQPASGEDQQTSSTSAEATTENLRKKTRVALGDKFLRQKLESGEMDSKCDLDIYLKETVIVVKIEDFDILKWWKLNQTRFPVLSYLARDILAMPISTVASESAFSTSGRVLDAFRSSLTPKVVESLICAQNWLKQQDVITSIEDELIDTEKFEEGLSSIVISDTAENSVAN